MSNTPKTPEQRAADVIAAERADTGPFSGGVTDPVDGPVYSRESLMTEQEKNFAHPVAELVEPTERSVPMTLAPREPYPTGNPQNPTWAEINGYTGPLTEGPLVERTVVSTPSSRA
jgi:hypothetical protein